MATEAQTQTATEQAAKTYRFDLEAFCEWGTRQIETSNDALARFICEDYRLDNGNRMWELRLRESVRDAPEEIVFIRGDNVDTLRFNYGDQTRQFHAHQRDVQFHERTLTVHAEWGDEICRAGTTTTTRRGPFPL